MQRLLTTREAAEWLGVSGSFLERDRWAGARIPFVKLGRAVRYDPAAIERYLASCVRRSTSDNGSGTESECFEGDR
jgi:excisionase family DNA binding protein